MFENIGPSLFDEKKSKKVNIKLEEELEEKETKELQDILNKYFAFVNEFDTKPEKETKRLVKPFTEITVKLYDKIDKINNKNIKDFVDGKTKTLRKNKVIEEFLNGNHKKVYFKQSTKKKSLFWFW